MRKIAIVVCLVSMAFASCGKDDNPAIDATPKATTIDVDATEYAFGAETSVVVDSLAEITIKNSGAEVHQAALLKTADGKTLDDVMAFFANEGAPSGPPPYAVAGGVGAVEPGASATITQTLPAGSYAFFCFIPSPDGAPHFVKGMRAPLTVTGNSTTTLPLPDGENAIASEFKFDLPSLKAGKTVLRGKNAGQQDHEFQLTRVADDKTADDALNWLTTPQGPPPMAFIGGNIVGPGGGSGSFVVNLTKGTYVMVCRIPDPSDGKAHFLKGMFSPVTIT